MKSSEFIQRRWGQGYRDLTRAIELAGSLAAVSDDTRWWYMKLHHMRHLVMQKNKLQRRALAMCAYPLLQTAVTPEYSPFCNDRAGA
jgi:hypothetical protein